MTWDWMWYWLRIRWTASPRVDLDGALDLICERLGMLPPWTQWQDKIAPISAKRGQVEPLRTIISKRVSINHP